MSGFIKGRVTDKQGKGIKNVKIYPSDASAKQISGTDYVRTDENGNYQFPTDRGKAILYLTAESIIGYRKKAQKVNGDVLNFTMLKDSEITDLESYTKADLPTHKDDVADSKSGMSKNKKIIIGIVIAAVLLVGTFLIVRAVRK